MPIPDAIGEDMGIKTESQDLDHEAAKPKFSGEAFSGFVRLKFTKNGLNGVNIYSRLKGSLAGPFFQGIPILHTMIIRLWRMAHRKPESICVLVWWRIPK